MKRVILASVSLAFVISASLAAKNLRMGFPQIAVGGGAATTLDLINKGVAPFRGSLAVVDDNGFFLPVRVNGVHVEDFLPLNISANRVERFRLEDSGELQVGHVLIWDDLPEGEPDLRSAIFGTAVFEIRSGGALIDSIGVPQAFSQEYFFFPAEVGAARTGLALSNPLGSDMTVTLRALSGANRLEDIETFILPGFAHRSFFIDEVMALPPGFRGTVEVNTDHRTFALALRQQGTQLSSIAVRDVPVLYEIEILAGGTRLTGELGFENREGSLIGVFRFDNLALDTGFGVAFGAALEGFAIVTLVATRNSRDLTGYFASNAFRTVQPTFTAPVVWDGSVGTILGTRVTP